MSEQIAAAKMVEKGVQGGVLAKLFIFSLSLAVVPITSYFASEKYLWNGNSTFAALTAAFSANLVLAGYIVMSIREESKAASMQHTGDGKLSSAESRKNK